MNSDLLTRALELDRAGTAFALATVVRAEKPTSAKPGAGAIVTADGAIDGWVGGSCAQPTVVREALKALRDGQPRLVRLTPPEKMGQGPQEGVVEVALTCVSGGTLEVYIEPHAPRPHLIVVGHLPVAQALCALAKDLGYEVSAMSLEASPDQFPRADRFIDRLDFARIPASPGAYVVVASHGNYDEEALSAALKTGALYVALVASRARAAKVVQYLREDGLSADQLARLKVPAGLDFGAVAPEEIALSILAEIVQVRRQSPGGHSLSTVEVAAPAEAIDPVCGMTVDIATARYLSEHAGKTYYFCAAGCQRSFERDPGKYAPAAGS